MTFLFLLWIVGHYVSNIGVNVNKWLDKKKMYTCAHIHCDKWVYLRNGDERKMTTDLSE